VRAAPNPTGSVPGVSDTVTSSNETLAYDAIRPIFPEPNVLSVAEATCVPFTNPVSAEPNASSRSVYQVPGDTATFAVASVVTPPPETRRSCAVPAPVSTSE
jgi:hypothetical protein